MSITDELREYALGWDERNRVRRDLRAIADRIDAEHERAMADAYLSGTPTDEKLTELGWIRLPVDADGEYIHVGERVQLIGNDPSTVSHMSLADDGWRVYVKYDGGIGTGSGEPKRIRHHHAPTVEDVLTEMVAKVIERGELTNGAAQTIAKYAAKLRLAEEDA